MEVLHGGERSFRINICAAHCWPTFQFNFFEKQFLILEAIGNNID